MASQKFIRTNQVRISHKRSSHEPNNLSIRLIFSTVFEPNKSFNQLMATYNWQQKDWPKFVYTLQKVEDDLFAFTERAGHVSGLLKPLDRICKQKR